MKKIALVAVMLMGLAACEKNDNNMEDLNSIPEEVGNVTPEV